MRKYLALLVCLFCVFTALALPVRAADVDSTEPSSLTLHYYAINEDQPLADATFFLYLVAEPDGEGGYTVTHDFRDYNVDLSDLDWNDAGRLTALAGTLSAYAARDEVEPLRMGATDVKGDLIFDGLDSGLYLVWGDPMTVAVDGVEWIFTPQALLLPLPYPNANGADIHDMKIDVKYERFLPPTPDDFIDITVTKVWEGGAEHPGTVIAQLLQNGEVSDEVELNDGNDWKHIWSNLSMGYDWQIVEKEVPEGYTVSVTQDGYDFIITNTSSIPDNPPESTEDDSTEENPTDNPTSEAPTGGNLAGNEQDDPSKKPGDNLSDSPFTGDLPFQILILLTIWGFVAIILTKRKQQENQ